jgi:predicted nucleic-acid-binding protein
MAFLGKRRRFIKKNGVAMIVFDTNLLVRYLTGDDESRCKKVEDLINRYQGAGNIFLSAIVLGEAA